jgi:hypothetical protein
VLGEFEEFERWIGQGPGSWERTKPQIMYTITLED